ncbi:unnamed protein product [Calicophoron daubneyi]|uniref:FCP1 homology domain-containing protein n=1 Tax=Calicophoron daubneyi TaxID=300641 RepID=A0AAV2TUJ1_CALDB
MDSTISAPIIGTDRNELPMVRRASAGVCNGDHRALAIPHLSHDDMSVEDCENFVLSPRPVPINLETAWPEICAAARRSNSSRTHSIKTQQLDGHFDNHSETNSHPSEQELSKSKLKEIPSNHSSAQRSPSLFSWRFLICCFSDNQTRKVRKAPEVSEIPSKVENGDATAKTPRKNKRVKLFWSRRPSDFRTNNIQKLPDVSDRSVSIGPPKSNHDSTSAVPTNPAFRPVLPNIVLRSLTSHHNERPASCPISCSIESAEGDFRVSNSLHPLSSAQQSTRAHSSAAVVCPRFPGLKRVATSPTDNVGANRNSQAVNAPQDGFSNPQDQVEVRTRIEHYKTWESGDTVDAAATSVDVEYSSDAEQNGGQGDSCSENLDNMTPGMDLLGELPPDCANKKCLVLDLDETLVHSWFKQVDDANFVVPVEIDGVKHEIYVCKRPHLDEFLRAIGPLFECVMFTASLKKYADPVCDYIDEASYFRHRLFREACVYHQNNLIKDLSRLGRDVDQICIVDNSPVSFLFQPNNALQIVSWFDDPNDQALLELIPYLTGLAKSETVVDYLREYPPPITAAMAQPPTPSWLLLFHPGAAGGMGGELDENEGSEQLDDIAYDYSEEDAVLSPHFHPPPVQSVSTVRPSQTSQAGEGHSSTTTATTITTTQIVHRQAGAPPTSTTSSFIHQMSRPEPGVGMAVRRLAAPVGSQDAQT